MKDRDTINRICRITAFTWIVTVAVALCMGRPTAGLNITIGAAMSMLMFGSIVAVAGAIFRGGKARKIVWLAAAVKYPLIGALLYALVRWEGFSIVPFVAGFMLLYSSILIDTVKSAIADRHTPVPEGSNGEGGF